MKTIRDVLFARWFVVIVLSIVLATGGEVVQAQTPTLISREKANLKRLGARFVTCPKFIAEYETAVGMIVNRQEVLCLSQEPTKKSSYKATPFALTPSFQTSEVFTPIEESSGQVDTEPFSVGSIPAVLTYSFTPRTDTDYLQMTLFDAATGRSIQRFSRVNSQVTEASISILRQGDFFVRLSAVSGAAKGDAAQPLFSGSLDYSAAILTNDEIVVTREDVINAKITRYRCPVAMINVKTKKISSLGGLTLVCTNSDRLSKVGFRIFPGNLVGGMFLTDSVRFTGAGTSTTAPFALSGPTPLTYTYNGTGRFTVNLMELATGKIVRKLVSVKGAFRSIVTTINAPAGSYYLQVKGDTAKLGEKTAMWQVIVEKVVDEF